MLLLPSYPSLSLVPLLPSYLTLSSLPLISLYSVPTYPFPSFFCSLLLLFPLLIPLFPSPLSFYLPSYPSSLLPFPFIPLFPFYLSLLSLSFILLPSPLFLSFPPIYPSPPPFLIPPPPASSYLSFSCPPLPPICEQHFQYVFHSFSKFFVIRQLTGALADLRSLEHEKSLEVLLVLVAKIKQRAQ